jgi:hypothetical protein
MGSRRQLAEQVVAAETELVLRARKPRQASVETVVLVPLAVQSR